LQANTRSVVEEI